MKKLMNLLTRLFNFGEKKVEVSSPTITEEPKKKRTYKKRTPKKK